MASVVLKKVTKAFGKVVVQKDIDLEIIDGEFIAFVGPSGCGKTTLLRMIAGLEDITAGDLYIDDKRVNDVPPSERSISMVFQSYALYPHLNLKDNMTFGLRLKKTDPKEIEARLDYASSILQLGSQLEKKPKELSGGQQQRVAIGRTLVNRPKVLLFDEPLSNLDASLRVQMRIEISKLHKRLNSTMVYVTHDQVEAMTMADRIVVLEGGRIAQVGTPLELYHYPKNRFVAGFIGSPKMNFINAKVVELTSHGVKVLLPNDSPLTVQVEHDNLSIGEAVSVGIRPEHIDTSVSQQCNNGAPEKTGLILSSEIQVLEQLGHETQIYVEATCIESDLIIRYFDVADVALGQQFKFRLPEYRCHLFKKDGTACQRTYQEIGASH
ncbi:maltose/maltodextrin ABC transporter ATP-binding protein MalK [Psychromonas sp. psych-6C06]|uniref:maltose/maltodextrin ABC transporter ATP-binding protein MalK n=1 Tax=Psychromonas sp. psych-6C06 TaxID=2058089 RepID=UPI000C328DEF|nr:maltose/maltodextrin ABC transporter ATP-binding protein MalK [Psychromonas sp. psych-6C06]PKF61944.1 maltose/maltodextrin ABC transporter ATP-binding protein MalK [Psychromonas sp. psych-6C06]